jgi:hypothetical protein
MTREEAERAVRAAMAQVAANHRTLLEIGVSERALCHHLANLLAQQMTEHRDVDVEYNRHARFAKRLNLPPRDAHDDDVAARTVFPDIIVHIRGTDEANDIVLEVKKPGEPATYDDLKLRAFRNELRYQHCGHVILGVDAAGRLVSELRWLDG